MEEVVKYLHALLLLQLQRVQTTAEKGANPQLELMLSDAGFAHAEIAEMLGKRVAAVAKAVSRARASRQTQASSEGAVASSPGA